MAGPTTREEREREKAERLAAALRANLRRRKQPPQTPADD